MRLTARRSRAGRPASRARLGVPLNESSTENLAAASAEADIPQDEYSHGFPHGFSEVSELPEPAAREYSNLPVIHEHGQVTVVWLQEL